MAPRNGQGAKFIGFDPPVPPFTATWKDQHLDPQDSGHVLSEADFTITINYDQSTGVLAASGTSLREPGCRIRQFITFPSTPQQKSVSQKVGDDTFLVSDLGVTTIAELNAAGFTADR